MNAIRKALVRAIETNFKGDAKRIDHAIMVTEYAEELLAREGGDYRIVIGASLLHDIGIHTAERKYGSTSGKYQEKEGPPIARRILTKLGFEPAQIEEVCQIIAHHHSPGKINTQNFKILYDADWLVNLRDEYDIQDRQKLANIIDRIFLTKSGKALAEEVYLLEASPDKNFS
jgi:HD superfamily phosphodiesterase|tara:strand:+ start:153 stop:671 length:519 start_codon:yes stop_codon:yes gene_type:complete